METLYRLDKMLGGNEQEKNCPKPVSEFDNLKL